MMKIAKLNKINKKGRKVITLSGVILLVCFCCMPSTYLMAGEKLFNYSLLGGFDYSKNNLSPSIGGLISVKLKGDFKLETGYKCDFFIESKRLEVLSVSNSVLYHTIPVGFTYSLKNFDFVLGTAFHFTGYAEMSVDRVYNYLDREERTAYLDGIVTTENYRKLFCSLFCNVRYNFDDYYALGATYGFAISDRYKNTMFESPLHYISISFYLRLNDALLR